MADAFAQPERLSLFDSSRESEVVNARVTPISAISSIESVESLHSIITDGISSSLNETECGTARVKRGSVFGVIGDSMQPRRGSKSLQKKYKALALEISSQRNISMTLWRITKPLSTSH